MPKAAKRKGARKKQNRIQQFFRETIGELRRVSWPTRQEATSLTIIVLIVIILMSSFLGLLDVIYSRFFALLFAS